MSEKQSPGTQSSLASVSSITDPTFRPSIERLESTSIVGNADSHTPPANTDSELPDIDGYDFELQESKGPATIRKLWRLDRSFYDREIDHEDIPPTCGIILDGADKYLREYALSEIHVPLHYSKMDTVRSHYRWSADGKTHVSGHTIKRAVRLTNGKGHIDRDTTFLILCAPGTLVATGPRGVFWINLPKTTSVAHDYEPMPTPPSAVTHDVRGIELPEEHPQLRDGFKQYVDRLASNGRPTPASCKLTHG